MLKKKSFVTLSSLTLALISITAYADKDVNADCLVTIPCLKPRFEYNVAALWLRPGASNLNYAIYNKELPAQSPTWTERELKPNYSIGFELGVRYVFPCACGKDIRLIWDHVYSSTSASVSAPDDSYFIGPDFEIGPAGLTTRAASGDVKFHYDIVNLDVGQHVNFGQYVALRFFAGLSGGSLRENLSATYSGTLTTPPAGPWFMAQESKSSFKGIGPRFGIGTNVALGCGFSVLGEGAISALIGSMSAKTNFDAASPILLATYGQTTNSQYIDDQRVVQVIPGFDAKLGVNYRYDFGCNRALTASLGYQAAVYVNAISQYLPQSLVTPMQTGGIFVATMVHRLSNFSVQGPFLNLSLQFD